MTPITRRPLRSLAIGLAGLMAGLMLLAVAVALFWPEDHLRERVTRQASEQLGMTVAVTGDVSLRFWPVPAIRATGVTIGSESDDHPVGELEAISLSVGWLPLLRGELVPETLVLDSPILRLSPGAVDSLVGEQPDDERRGGEFAPLDLRIHDGEIHWRAGRDDPGISITGLELELTDFDRQPVADEAPPWARTSLQLTASAEALHIHALELSDIDLEMAGKDGVFRSDDLEMTFLGSRGTGNARLDLSAATPSATLDIDFDSLDLANLPEAWVPTNSFVGNADLTASLETRGQEPGRWLRHLDGEIRLSGRDLQLRGVDLDEELARYRRTQRFSLVDAAAVVFLGPAALLASKGSDFARLLGEGDVAETRIVHLVSDWRFDAGTAQTRDVALSTTRNRLATQASLDLPSRRINHTTVAVVDRRGCAVMEQEVHGSLDAPVIEEPHVVEALLGAPLGLLQRGVDAISRGGEDCEVFYAGSVAAPSD
ncbi:MAG: AsmA family protein [Guyparkeria sp.]